MSQSTRDEPDISPKEFSILREIVKGLPDIKAEADLKDATASYERVLAAHKIDPSSDEVYFRTLLRLNHYEGTTWADKLLKAAGRIETKLRSSAIPVNHGHQRHRSSVNIPKAHRDLSIRSVIQQKLDRGGHLSHPEPSNSYSGSRSRPALPREVDVRALTREEKNAFVERYKLFLRRQLTKKTVHFFGLWRQVTDYTQQFREEQWHYAVQRDHDTLLLQGLEIWQDAFYAHVEAHRSRAFKAETFVLKKAFRQWETRIIERRQGQFLARLAAEKQALFDALLLKNQKKLVRRSFRKWKVKHRKWRVLEQKALILRDKRTEIVVWKQWFFRTCEYKTAAIYDRKMLSRTLKFWIVRLHHVQILHQRAVHKHMENLLCEAWDVWRIETSFREGAREVAALHASAKLLRKTVKTWQHRAQLAQRSDQVQARIELRLLTSVVTCWQKRARTRQGLLRTAEHTRLKNLFAAWRRENSASVAITRFNKCRLQASFSYWRIETKGTRHKYSTEIRQLSRAFSHWSTSFVNITNRVESAEHDVIRMCDASLQRLAFNQWSGRQTSIQQLQTLAIDQYGKTLVSSAVAAFRERLRDNRFQSSRALKFELKTTSKRYLHIWFQQFVAKRIRDREIKLQRYIGLRKQRALSQSLQRWQLRNRGFEEAHIVAKEMLHDREQSHVRYFFTAWNDRHMDIFEMQRVGRDYERQQASSFIFQTLLEKFLHRRALNELADKIYNPKAHALGEAVLRKWRERYQERYHRELEKEMRAELSADLFAKRQQRSIFRRWLATTRIQRRAARTYVGDASSDSLDASRTRVRWNDSPTIGSRRNRSILDYA